MRGNAGGEGQGKRRGTAASSIAGRREIAAFPPPPCPPTPPALALWGSGLCNQVWTRSSDWTGVPFSGLNGAVWVPPKRFVRGALRRVEVPGGSTAQHCPRPRPSLSPKRLPRQRWRIEDLPPPTQRRGGRRFSVGGASRREGAQRIQRDPLERPPPAQNAAPAGGKPGFRRQKSVRWRELELRGTPRTRVSAAPRGRFGGAGASGGAGRQPLADPRRSPSRSAPIYGHLQKSVRWSSELETDRKRPPR